jgi:hypothetical protein
MKHACCAASARQTAKLEVAKGCTDRALFSQWNVLVLHAGAALVCDDSGLKQFRSLPKDKKSRYKATASEQQPHHHQAAENKPAPGTLP